MTVSVNGTTGITFNDASAQNTATKYGMVNRIINGAMMIDQRNAGASVTPTVSAYTLDRWFAVLSQSSKFSVQQNAGSVTPPNGFKNYLGVTSSSAYSIGSTDFFIIRQAIEGFNVADLGWGTASASSVSISFWVRSSLTGTFGATLMNSAANRSYPFTYTISAANTWEQKTVTVAGDASGTWLSDNGVGLYIQFGLGIGSTYSGTSGAWTGTSNIFGATGATSVVGTNGATFYITGVQLEKGSTATSFDYRPYGTELQLCYRYYEQWSSTDQNLVGFCYASNNINTYTQFTVEKRATPTLTRNGTFTAYVNGGGNTLTYANYVGSTKAININWTGGGISAGQAFAWSSPSNPQIAFSAEL
jgi:hypothetical protein